MIVISGKISLGKTKAIGTAVLVLLLLAPIAAHAWSGGYSRYIADDFCTAWTLGEKGIIESQIFWYTTWSGRYAFTLFINVLQAFGSGITSIAPGLTLVAWVLSLWVLARKSTQIMGSLLSKGTALVVSLLGVVTIAQGVPNTFQSIYWLTGISTYSTPLILLSAYGAWLLHTVADQAIRPRPWIPLAISAFFAFITGGFSETNVSLQTALLIAALVISLSFGGQGRGKAMTWLLSSGLGGSLGAIAVILVSPGTGIRSGLISNPTGIFHILQTSVLDLKIFVSLAMKTQLPWLMLCGALPGILILSTTTENSSVKSDPGMRARDVAIPVLLPPLLMFLVMLATVVPYELAVSSFPDARVLITTQAVMVIGCLFWSMLLGRLLERALRGRSAQLSTGVIALLISSIAFSGMLVMNEVRDIAANTAEMQYFAQSWDSRNANLLEAARSGLGDVEAASLNHMGGLDEIGHDPNEWINRCIAQYYELKSVVAK